MHLVIHAPEGEARGREGVCCVSAHRWLSQRRVSSRRSTCPDIGGGRFTLLFPRASSRPSPDNDGWQEAAAGQMQAAGHTAVFSC